MAHADYGISDEDTSRMHGELWRYYGRYRLLGNDAPSAELLVTTKRVNRTHGACAPAEYPAAAIALHTAY